MVQNVLKHPNFCTTTLTMKCTAFPSSIIQGSEWISHLRYFQPSLVSSCSTFPVSSPCRGGFCSSFFFFSAALKRPRSQRHHGTLQTTVLSLLQHSALHVRCTRMDVRHHPASGVRREFTGRTLVIQSQSSSMMKMFWSFSMQFDLDGERPLWWFSIDNKGNPLGPDILSWEKMRSFVLIPAANSWAAPMLSSQLGAVPWHLCLCFSTSSWHNGRQQGGGLSPSWRWRLDTKESVTDVKFGLQTSHFKRFVNVFCGRASLWHGFWLCNSTGVLMHKKAL